MDRALYVGMTGAMQTLQAQTANNNNLANASTVGFRAQLVDAQAVPVQGPGFPSRVNAQLLDQGWDSSQGVIMHTGNDLDVAMTNNAWLAVQATDGSEAYTKAGSMHVDSTGALMTSDGLPVLSDTGPITIPSYSTISIGGDGTISIVPAGQTPSTLVTVGRLKVVSAQSNQLQRSTDGLMRAPDGVTLNPAPGNSITADSLESSNVNIATTMVTMIQLARQFELQTKVMQTADSNASASSSLVKLTS